MLWIIFRTSQRPRVPARARAVALLALLIIFPFLTAVAWADQPFKIESEAGEVIDFQGNVHEEETGVNQYGVQPILPLPVKEKPSAEIKRAPAEPVKKPEQGDMSSHEFKRAKPSIIKKTAADKTEKKSPEADAEEKPDTATGAEAVKEDAPPYPVKAEPDESAGDEEKLPLPIPSGNEKEATAKESQAPSKPLPLMRGVSFSLSSEGIEYNWRTKTLRAKSGFYSQNGIAIIADEIRIDLHKGLLAASGHVTLYFDATMAMKGHNYIGHLLLYNLQTMEAAVETDSGTSYLSPVETAAASGLADDSFMGTVTLDPAAAAPSLSGVGIVEYSGGGEDVIKARSMSLSVSNGISFTGVDYTVAGKEYKLPSFQTRSGELKQKTFNVNSLSTYQTPSEHSFNIAGAFSYYFDDDPHRMTVLDDNESITFNKGSPNHKNTFFHGISRRAIFGNNIFTFALSTQKAQNTSGYASFRRYWFPDGKTTVNFSYGKYLRDMKSTGREPFVDKYTNAGLGIARNSKYFTINASSSSMKGKFDYDENIVNTFKNTTYYPDFNYSLNNNYFTLYQKPARIAGRRLFLYNYFDYSKYLTVGSDSDLPGLIGLRLWGYKMKNTYIDYKSGLTTGEIRIAGRLYGTARMEYESYSSKLSFVSNNGWYNTRQYSKTDEGRGIAGLEWKFSGKGVAGADYVWNRKDRKGYSVITPYLSYAGSTRWNVRLSGRYHEEMAAGKDIFAAKRLMSEMFDVSTKLSKNSTLQASWDLDNAIHGVTLYSVDLKSDSRKGLTVFSVSKYTTTSTAYSYWGPILITTITDSTPYRYSLSYYPK